MQLLAMGYDADLLKTGFNEDQIKAAAEDFTLSITVANICERQEALVKATMHGKKFFVTGGEHINSNDINISAEMGNREREIAAMERVKRNVLSFTRGAMLLLLCSTASAMSWMATLRGLPTKIWRFFSGGRVCFHQRWATWQIKELYISSLPATEETTIWATLLDGRRRTRPI